MEAEKEVWLAWERPEAFGERLRKWPRRAFGAVLRWLLFRAHLARVSPLEYRDFVTDDLLTIRRSARFLILSVEGRDYYFDPLTGKLDGTGSLQCCG